MEIQVHGEKGDEACPHSCSVATSELHVYVKINGAKPAEWPKNHSQTKGPVSEVFY